MRTRSGLMAAFAFATGIGVASAAVITPSDVKFIDATIPESIAGQPGDPAKGREAFADRKLGNCLACHANKDLQNEQFHGDVGPDLSAVGSRYDAATLRAIVVNAKQVFGEETIMPAFYHAIEDQRVRKDLKGQPILSAEQVEDVVAYLLTLKE